MALSLKADHLRIGSDSAVPDRANIVRLSISGRQQSSQDMPEVYDVEARALTGTLSDCTALTETAYFGEGELGFILWFNSEEAMIHCSLAEASSTLLTPADVVAFKRGRHKPSYRSVPPLDTRRLPTFN